MGRTKKTVRKPTSSKKPPTPPTPPTYTTIELLHQSAALIASTDYEGAKLTCEQAVELAQTNQDVKGMMESLEILGTIELELGELDNAREHFLLSIQYAVDFEDPSPAPYLYLAQLSTPEESLTHFTSALAILQAKLAVIEHSKLGLDGGAGTEEDAEDEFEYRRSASRALIGMTELYLTNLCFEDGAELFCEQHLASAVEVDPINPEIYQTLASVRLSQERAEEAKEAAYKGWSLWRDLGPESPDYPSASSRLSLAQLLLELSNHADALEILQRLENEDDEDPEVWYLSGWAWWLLGEARPVASTEGEGEEETQGECWSEGKLCLDNYLRLDEQDPGGSDPEQLAHVHELVEKMNAVGVIASDGRREGEQEWSDDSEGEEEENIDDIEMK